MRMYTIAMTLVSSLLTFSPVGAADEAAFKVEMPDSSPLPVKMLVHGQIREYVWAAAEGYRPRMNPLKPKEFSGAPGLKFMEKCGCVDYRQVGTDEYLLLVKGTPGKPSFRYLGWVEMQLCVLGNEAKMTPKKIHRKAMIVNTAQTVEEERKLAKENKQFLEVPIRLNPEDGKSIGSFNLFNIFFIWADTKPNDDEGGDILLGNNYFFKDDDFTPDLPKETVLGWVPKKRVCLWNTREALEWNWVNTQKNAEARRIKPGVVYKKLEDAKAAMEAAKDEMSPQASPRKEKANIDPLFIENFDEDGVSRPMRNDQMRFPIIPIKADEQVKVGDKLGGKIFHVGFVGSVVDDKGQKVADAAAAAQFRRELRRLKEELELTEILFVLDSTKSMDEAWKGAAEAIEKIMKSVTGDKSRKVRIALVEYNDIDDGPEATRKRKTLADTVTIWKPANVDKNATGDFLELDAKNDLGSELVGYIKKRARDGLEGGGDAKEQMFYGLKTGITSVHWTRYARKIVVLIGDTGSKLVDAKEGDFSEAGIVKALIPAFDEKHPDELEKSPIDFFAVHYVEKAPKEGEELTEDFKAFKTQVDEMMSIYDKELDKFKLKDPARHGYLLLSDSKEISDSLVKRYNLLQKQSSELANQVAIAERGDWENLKIGPEFEKILTTRNPELYEFIKKKGIQLFHSGYVWEFAPGQGARQVRVNYLVTKDSLLQLSQILSPLVEVKADKKLSDEAFARALVGASTGEPLRTNESFDSIKLRSLGLEVQSDLLRRSLGEVKYGLEAQQQLQDIKQKVMRLDDLYDPGIVANYAMKTITTQAGEQLRVWQKANAPDANIKKDSSSRPGDRRFKLYGGSTFWLWVDQEDEWP